MINYKRKEFGSKFFPFEVDPFSVGVWNEGKQNNKSQKLSLVKIVGKISRLFLHLKIAPDKGTAHVNVFRIFFFFFVTSDHMGTHLFHLTGVITVCLKSIGPLDMSDKILFDLAKSLRISSTF